MKQSRLLFLATVLILSTIGVWNVVQAEDHVSVMAVPIWFGTEMSLEPDTETGGAWRCRVILTDLGSEEVLSVPTIRFAAGEEAAVTSEIRPGMLFEFKVKVDREGRSATWISQIRQEDQVLSSGSGAVELATG